MLNTARIAKNTIFLYLRMVLVLAANFLAVRVLLEVLGIDDYGLFNLIVGFVTLFTLLNGAMMSTVQRFLCFELGRATSMMSLPSVDAVSSPRQKKVSNSVSILSSFSFLPLPLLLLCRERNVLTACSRHFLVTRENLVASRFRFSALSTNVQFNYQERIKQP